MATNIFLGNPPENIKQFIIENYAPQNTLTKITFADGTIEEYNIQGELTRNKLSELGIVIISEYTTELDQWEHGGPIKVEIGNSVTSITQNAFAYCGTLENVTIPNSVTHINELAFYYCNLTDIIIPNSVTHIGESAFRHNKITNVIIPDSVLTVDMFSFCENSKLTDVIIGDGVTSIGWSAFWDCRSLNNIIIGSSVTSIEETAFAENQSIKNVSFKEKTKNQVQNMTNYPWNFPVSTTIHCTDGDIII